MLCVCVLGACVCWVCVYQVYTYMHNIYIYQVYTYMYNTSSCSPPLSTHTTPTLRTLYTHSTYLVHPPHTSPHLPTPPPTPPHTSPHTSPLPHIPSPPPPQPPRLFHTREVLHHCLVHPNLNVLETLEQDPQAYSDVQQLQEPLVLMYNSLLETGDVYIAKGMWWGRDGEGERGCLSLIHPPHLSLIHPPHLLYTPLSRGTQTNLSPTPPTPHLTPPPPHTQHAYWTLFVRCRHLA